MPSHDRRRVSRRGRSVVAPIAALAWWLASTVGVLACPVCFRMEEGPVVSGVRAAVLVLVGVTTLVLSGFGMFIVRFVRRSL